MSQKIFAADFSKYMVSCTVKCSCDSLGGKVGAKSIKHADGVPSEDDEVEERGAEKVAPAELRFTQELVFGIVAPIGSGATTVAKILKQKIEENFGYQADVIKVSDIINERAKSLDERVVGSRDPDRVERLQSLGNKLREHYSNDVLAVFSIDKINSSRKNSENGEDRRFCTIIDSLKNPEEAAILRKVYGDLFWLVGVFSPEQKRIARLEKQISSSSYLAKIKAVDYDEGSSTGQSVRKTMNYADVFFGMTTIIWIELKGLSAGS
ncbi:hypothetical protein KCX83_04665 [Brucella oryzae]|uniref:hypothetical protein n=1 Tax=Brucella oryzae TaxID=335286 RepID=UPI001B8443F6|nr:hypothetical protein [Brucella oryzae]MBR7651613.1 hypothetical protein [Brucella oryzae]